MKKILYLIVGPLFKGTLRAVIDKFDGKIDTPQERRIVAEYLYNHFREQIIKSLEKGLEAAHGKVGWFRGLLGGKKKEA